MEGARAQLRIIESKSLSKSEYGSPEQTPTRSAIMLPPVTSTLNASDSQLSLYRDANQVSTPSMKAMIPLVIDDGNILHHSSSTESAQDNEEVHASLEMPKQRPPSKIPLPGQKGYVAPKPPSGKSFAFVKNSSGPPSTKSLSKSTGSLQVVHVQGQPSSITKNINTSRCESSQSWRSKEVSLERQKNSNGSSIPISSNNKTFVKLNTSPVLPRTKRDSLTSRVKNLDSLSRHMSHTHTSLCNSNNLPSTTTANSINSRIKKDLSTSFAIHNNNNSLRGGGNSSVASGGRNYIQPQPTVPIRRISSSSMHRFSQPTNNNSVNKNNPSSSSNSIASVQQDTTEAASDGNKVRGSIRANFWNWLKT